MRPAVIRLSLLVASWMAVQCLACRGHTAADATVTDTGNQVIDAGVDTTIDPADGGAPDTLVAPDADAAPAPLPPCGTDSPGALAACADRARYVTDLTAVAAARPPGSAHWMDVQDLCATRFASLGYDVERQVYATGVNVVGVRRGTTAANDSVLLSAHYDHIAGCAGADDNGSGVAGLLEAARVLAMRPHARTLVVACWDEEERGLIGSMAYAQRARTRGDAIVGNFVFEMIGFASSAPDSQTIPMGLDLLFRRQVQQLRANMMRGDFLAVILDQSSHDPVQHLLTYGRSVGLPIVLLEVPGYLLADPAIANLRRSDHASFWQANYPGAQLTDTANFRNPHYHCMSGADTIDTLDHDFATNVVRATVGAVARTLEGP